MLFTPLISAGIERLLNTVLYRDSALKLARQQVQGKVLCLSLQEFATPLVLVFAEQQVDVLNHWQDKANANVTTRLVVLMQLRDRGQLTRLIRNGDLDVQGDMQFVQQVVALLDLARGDLAYWLSCGLGDVGGETLSRCLYASAGWLKRAAADVQCHLAQVLTEEWRLAPGVQEVNGFADESVALAGESDRLSRRLDKLEDK